MWIQDNIKQQIAEPLENLYTGKESEVNWELIKSSVETLSYLPEGKTMIHESLKGLYWEYLCGNIPYATELHLFLNRMICDFQGLGEWMGSENILEIADQLLECKNSTSVFFNVMSLLIAGGYAPYITQWNKQRIEEEIESLSVQNNRKRGELFCVMQAYHSIATNKTLTDGERKTMYNLLREYWHYLVHIYSVMVKRIVGSNFKVFSQLINNVNIMPQCHPYIHLFYGAVLLRQDDIFPTDKDKEKATKNFSRMENIMKETPKDTLLDGLCQVLFGEEFEEVMARQNLPTYDEMKIMLKNYRETIAQMQLYLRNIVNQLKAAYEASVPISVIEKELLKLEPHTAMGILSELNMLLIGEKNWVKNAPDIKQKIQDKINEKEMSQQDLKIPNANITVGSVNTFNNNGIYNDFEGTYLLQNQNSKTLELIPIKDNVNNEGRDAE